MCDASPNGRLIVIGANPPSKSSGARTRGRVELARVILSYSEADIVNLFEFASYRTGGISTIGKDLSGWVRARETITSSLSSADGVVIAYGLQPPNGQARSHFVDQVDWLWQQLDQLDLPIWNVGGGPRHPSRWQRYTHREYPDLEFTEALRKSFTEVRKKPEYRRDSMERPISSSIEKWVL